MSTNKYYGRLAESLMRKQTGIKLTEAWADTMPSWMKDRLNKMAGVTDFESDHYVIPNVERKLSKYLRDPKFKQKFDQYKSLGYDDNNAFRYTGSDLGYLDKTDYATPRGASSEEKRNARKNIFRQFKDILGLDLQNLTFVESAPPKTARDISLQDPNIPIWHIQSSGQIYAKGVNDNEVLNAPSSSYNGKSFRYVPLKELSALCGGDFCYIDGSNLPSIGSKMLQRNEYDNWAKNSNNSGSLRGEPGERVDIPYENAQGRSRTWTGYRDKSGFARVPSALRYARELERMKANNYADKLLKIESDLRSAYSVLRSAQNVGTWSSPVDTRDFINQYNGALSSYKNLLADIDMMRNRGSDDEFMNYLISDDSYYRHTNGKWVPGFVAAIRQIQSQMNYVNNYKDKYDTAIVDI